MDIDEKYTGAAEPRYALMASAWAIGTVSILIVIKSLAYLKSDSTAILATLTDSINDAGISLMMLLALRYSLKPADKGHRHGHGKAEGLAALFQAAFLSGAGVFLGLSALERFARPVEVTDHVLSITVAGIAIVLSIILVAVQKYCLARAPSLAIEADRLHYTTDVFLNGTVVLALLVDFYGGPAWVDPLCGLFVAFYMFRAAKQVGIEAADMLMDRELPKAVRERIKEIVMRHDDVHDLHDLRTRKSGMTLHISFDVEIDPAMSLRDAHQVTRDLENMILQDFPQAEIIIHMDPVGDIHDARHTVKGVHH